MKTRFLIFGCFFAFLCLFCLSGCGEDEENIKLVAGITVTPANPEALEIGDELELTATFTPSDATEEIVWVTWDDKILSIEGNGTKAKIKALTFGETRIFATSKSRVVVSPDIPIKINSDDYAALMVGNYLGSGESNMGAISDINIRLERVGLSNSTLKMTIIAEMTGFGEQTIIAETVNISLDGSPGIYGLNGHAELNILGMVFDFVLTGTFDNADKSLNINLYASDPMQLDIDIYAVPGEATDFAASAAGDYIGEANGESAMGPVSGLEMAITITRISSSSIDLFIESQSGNIVCQEGQFIEIAAGIAANTCTLNGVATLTTAFGDFPMTVSGEFNLLEHTLTLDLFAEGMGLELMNVTVTAEMDITKLIVGEYTANGDLTGMMEMPLTDVPVAITRVDKATVNLFAATALATIDCNLPVTPDGNFYALQGIASIMGMDFTVTGRYNPSNQTLTLSIANSSLPLQIELSGVKN